MADDALDLLKRAACESIDSLEPELLRISHAIHAQPELAFEETHAAQLLVETLRGAELEVEAGAFGLETAFVSEFGSEPGACVAVLAEYDALPGIGHACGHNLIATSALGAGLALSTLRDHLPGRVRILGTPAEERGGGKELMARAGALEGVDAALMMHPSSVDLVSMPCTALAEVGVQGMTITEVKGFGRTGGKKEVYRGSAYVVDFVPKVKIDIVVPTALVDEVVDAIEKSAKTGRIGDGKIFVLPIDEAVRIRTGERNEDAI